MLWNARYRKYAPVLIAGVCTVICLALYWFTYVQQNLLLESLQQPEDVFKDLRARYGRLAERDPNLIFLAIEDTSHQLKKLSILSDTEIKQSKALQLMLDGFPYPRSLYPLLLDRLFQAGAKIVVLDLLFLNDTPNDAVFKEALDKYRDRVVVGWNFNEGEAGQSGSLAVNSGTYQFPTDNLIRQTTPLDDRLGIVNYRADSDNVIRAISYRQIIKGDSQSYDSLSAVAVRKAGIRLPVEVGTEMRLFRWTGWNDAAKNIDTGFRAYPIYEIFVPTFWEHNYKNGELFRNKIVVVGAKGDFTRDVHLTPFVVMPGPEIHLNALNALIHGDFLTETPHLIDFLLILLAGAGACGILLRSHSPGVTFFSFLLVNGLYLALSLFLYNYQGVYILMFFPLLCLNSTGFLGFTYEFIGEQIERRRTRATLERYVSKNLVREILDNPETFYNKVGGVRLPVTALFSDVRDFTTMTERADPTQMVSQLNEYLQEMTRIVFQYGGTLDKFVGDAVMAVWGNIRTVGTALDAENAVRTALTMLESLRVLNERWSASGKGTWVIGIGINQGEAIAGNIGSNEKMDLTVIGDAVNTASRLEGLTKKYHVPLLIGPTVAAQVRDKFYLQSVDRAAAKGKSNALDLYTVLGDKAQPLSKEWLSYLECYEEGVRLFRIKNFVEAQEMFESLLPYRPDDPLATLYVERCKKFIAEPPPENWSGVVIITEK